MDIGDIMDCLGCENHRFCPGRVSGDPDRCCPGETFCLIGAPDSGPCERMLGAIHDMVNDGCLETEHGQFRTRECLQDEQGEEGAPEGFRAFDFSSAPYFWVPDNYDTALVEPYRGEKEIYNAYFI